MLRRMNQPDYAGGCIVNLMASIIRARGGESDYPDLRQLPAATLAPARHVVLLVIDGLGDDWLQRHAPDGLLWRHRVGAICSVFPPTTASAITTYLTGDAPQQHALTGWHTWLRELGCVMSVLPGRPRYGGVGYRGAGVDVRKLFGHRPVSERIATDSVVIAPAEIASSDFNLAHLGRAKARRFEHLTGMFRQIARAIRGSPEASYCYAYWPRLDGIGHEQGIESDAAVAHLHEIEAALSDFCDRIADSGTLVLVCADHGQIDTAPSDRLDLAQHPELVECLTIPLCGEPRAAFCYVHPDRADSFEGYCREVLGERFDLYSSRALIASGVFGLGPPHPRLRERVGDYTLLARGNNVIRERLPFDRPFEQIGVHGGLSQAELMVPLAMIRP